MHCYNHPDLAAAGICKVCNKGLCPACAADLGHGLACRGVHEQRAEQIEQLISRNFEVQRSAVRSKYAAPAFYLFSGAVFLGYGLFDGLTLISLLGVGFLVFGSYVLVANRRAFGARAPDP